MCIQAVVVLQTGINRKWEDDPFEENAEMIAKHIIRMASRNTVNQLFGIVMADGVQSKENYFCQQII